MVVADSHLSDSADPRCASGRLYGGRMLRWVGLACLALALLACASSTAASITPASPSPSGASGPPAGSAAADSGAFHLELVLPRVEWKSDEPLTGMASLSFEGETPIKISGASSVLGFGYAEVDGTHVVNPAWRSVCATYDLEPATPIIEALTKSGGFSDEDPDVAWLRSFLTAPEVRLPAGTWDVTAVAEF